MGKKSKGAKKATASTGWTWTVPDVPAGHAVDAGTQDEEEGSGAAMTPTLCHDGEGPGDDLEVERERLSHPLPVGLGDDPGRLEPDVAAAQDLHLWVGDVGSPEDAGNTREELGSGDPAKDDDVEEPVVVQRVRDSDTAAEGRAVGDRDEHRVGRLYARRRR